MKAPDPWSEELRQHLVVALVEHAPTSSVTEAHLNAVIAETVSRPGKLVRARLAFTTALAHGIPDGTGLALATAVLSGTAAATAGCVIR